MRKFLYLSLVLFWLPACNKDNQSKTDQQIITQYIGTNHLNAVAEPNGLYYVQTVLGGGGSPNINSTVTVKYKGYLTDGTIFDQPATPSTFQLSGVIPGWQQGIPLMKAGGKATLLLPSALGYGAQAVSNIPANSVLIFDVQLISFQ